MLSLTDFLLTRIAEDEAELTAPTEFNRRAWAECEAKRRIVERAARASQAFDQSFNPTTSGVSMTMELVLADLAAVYADHPDYRDEWRP